MPIYEIAFMVSLLIHIMYIQSYNICTFYIVMYKLFILMLLFINCSFNKSSTFILFSKLLSVFMYK